MPRANQISKAKRRRKAVTAALGVAGALSLASGASASFAPTGSDTPTQRSLHRYSSPRRKSRTSACRRSMSLTGKTRLAPACSLPPVAVDTDVDMAADAGAVPCIEPAEAAECTEPAVAAP